MGEEEPPEAIQSSPAVKGAPQCHLPHLPQPPCQDSQHPRIFQDCPSEALAPGPSAPHSQPPCRAPSLLSLRGGGCCLLRPLGKEPWWSRAPGWQQGQWGGHRGPEPAPSPPTVSVCVCVRHTHSPCLGVFLCCSPDDSFQGTAVSFSQRPACLPVRRPALCVPTGALASSGPWHVCTHTRHTVSLREPVCSSVPWHRSQAAPG